MKTWGDIDERLDPLFYLNMMLLNKNIIQQAKYPVGTFKQKVNMQRGRFGHRPRNDPRYYGGEYPFIQTGNIVKASTANEKIEFTQTLNELGLSTSRLFNEKVLVITIAANIGYTAILDYAACFPDSLVALTSKDDSLSLEYLNEYIRFIRTYIENLAPQAAQKNINLKQLNKLPIILPNRDIQAKIVSIMEQAYAEKTAKENQSEALLNSINDYLLQELGIAMPPDEENSLESRMFYVNSNKVLGARFDPFYHTHKFVEYEKSLKSGKYPFHNLGEYIRDISYGASVDNCYTDSGIPLLRIKDLKPNEICSDEIVFLPIEMEKSLLKSRVRIGDVLITRSGTIGVCSVVGEAHDTFAFGSFMIKFELFNISPQYVSYLINSFIGKVYFERNKIGAIQGNITIPTIKSLQIPIPEPQKQIQIVQTIDCIREQAKQLDKEAQAALEHAKAQIEKILLGGEAYEINRNY